MLFWQGNMNTFVVLELGFGLSVVMFIGTKRKNKQEVMRLNTAQLI